MALFSDFISAAIAIDYAAVIYLADRPEIEGFDVLENAKVEASEGLFQIVVSYWPVDGEPFILTDKTCRQVPIELFPACAQGTCIQDSQSSVNDP